MRADGFVEYHDACVQRSRIEVETVHQLFLRSNIASILLPVLSLATMYSPPCIGTGLSLDF